MPPSLTFLLTAVPRQPPPTKRVAEVALELRTRAGLWVPVRIRVDTGANVTTMSYRFAADQLGLELPDPALARTGTARFADGRVEQTRRHPGTLTARFPELRAFVFRWECLFDESLPAAAPRLLGLGGRVLTDVCLTFRGGAPSFPEGSVTFEVLARPVPLFPPSDPLARECRGTPLHSSP